jgi:hypothetical protein
LFFHCFFSNAQKGLRKVVLRRVSILLTLFIFGMIAPAWCDPVKSINGAAIQLTTMKMDENKATMLKKTEPAKGSPEWLKKSQARPRDLNFLRTLEERKRSQWVESSDKVIYSLEFSENVCRNKFSNSLYATETKSLSSGSGQYILKPYPDGDGSFEEAKILTTLRLRQSREETFKEVFMGFRFSLDLTNGHVFLEINLTPSTEKRSGFLIRF